VNYFAFLLVCFFSIALTGCDKPTADFIAQGKLTGTSCPNVVYDRGSIKRSVDCVAVLANDQSVSNAVMSYTIALEYKELIGKKVAVVRVRENHNVLVPIEDTK
jgi:hypothetical protein